MKARDIMSAPPITVTADAPLKKVAALLVAHSINGVPVVEDGNTLLGIISEADLVGLETTPDPLSSIIQAPHEDVRLPRRVEQVMCREVVRASAGDDIADVARLMLMYAVKTVPVVEGTRVVGVVTRRDILQVVARADEELQTEIENLLSGEARVLGGMLATVEDGVVTLDGDLTPADMRLADTLVRRVPGVLAVRFRRPE